MKWLISRKAAHRLPICPLRTVYGVLGNIPKRMAEAVAPPTRVSPARRGAVLARASAASKVALARNRRGARVIPRAGARVRARTAAARKCRWHGTTALCDAWASPPTRVTPPAKGRFRIEPRAPASPAQRRAGVRSGRTAGARRASGPAVTRASFPQVARFDRNSPGAPDPSGYISFVALEHNWKPKLFGHASGPLQELSWRHESLPSSHSLVDSDAFVGLRARASANFH